MGIMITSAWSNFKGVLAVMADRPYLEGLSHTALLLAEAFRPNGGAGEQRRTTLKIDVAQGLVFDAARGDRFVAQLTKGIKIALQTECVTSISVQAFGQTQREMPRYACEPFVAVFKAALRDLAGGSFNLTGNEKKVSTFNVSSRGHGLTATAELYRVKDQEFRIDIVSF